MHENDDDIFRDCRHPTRSNAEVGSGVYQMDEDDEEEDKLHD